MAKWGEIKCPMCEELKAQITAMEEGLTAVHMAGYMDGKKAAEAKLELIQEEWAGAVYGDLENGVASLNEAAAKDFHRRYPLVANFATTISRIIDGGKDE